MHAAPAVELDRDQRALLDAYVDCFNRHDWAALQQLIASDARLDVIDRVEGKPLDANYRTNYLALAWQRRLSVARIDSELVVVHSRKVGDTWQPHTVISSGAAIQGSPVSGGYAPAKRAQWFLADYAATESKRAGLGIRVHCVLPNLNPSTELGRVGIAAYAARAGVTEAELAKRFEPQLTPEIFGTAIANLAANPTAWDQLAYRVGGRGLVAI